MNLIIKNYLIKNKKLTIGGLGVFEVLYQPAEIHPILHTFTPSGEYVLFEKNEKVSSDDFIAFITNNSKISKEEASQKINDWLSQLKESLKKEKQYCLGSLGNFTFDAVGNLTFHPSLDYDISPSSYGLENFTLMPDSINKKTQLENNEMPVKLPINKNKRKKKANVFYAFTIGFLLLIIAFGVYVLVCPADFIKIKNKMIAEMNLLFYKSDDIQFSATALSDSNNIKEQVITTERTTVVISDTSTYTESILIENDSYTETQDYEAKEGAYIVIGSFKQEENAIAFLQQKQTIYHNVVSLGQGKTSHMWLIAIGPYEMKEAQQYLKENNINGWILKK